MQGWIVRSGPDAPCARTTSYPSNPVTDLYQRLGGAPAVDAAVDRFYRRMLADERVAHFFDDTDMDGQIQKQKAFLTMAFGGPHNYSGRDMRSAHAPLLAKGLDDSHVDIVVAHLGGTLKELGVDDSTIGEVAAIAESVRNDVLSR
ncbi:MAG: group 1 truncated hemoglobin [Planctomycetaceae bacterium]|nr:group 1 truncated hemoglobin [Planctomycetaceae bacterium]